MQEDFPVKIDAIIPESNIGTPSEDTVREKISCISILKQACRIKYQTEKDLIFEWVGVSRFGPQ